MEFDQIMWMVPVLAIATIGTVISSYRSMSNAGAAINIFIGSLLYVLIDYLSEMKVHGVNPYFTAVFWLSVAFYIASFITLATGAMILHENLIRKKSVVKPESRQ